MNTIPTNSRVPAAPPNPARYTAADPTDLKRIIDRKLADTRATILLLEQSLLLDQNNGTDVTARRQNLAEDGQCTLEREEAARIVARLRKFQQELHAACVRIAQGTYGICRATGELIPTDRLRAVPYATLRVEAKK